MPRFNKWLPFFETPSEKRDVASWEKEMKALTVVHNFDTKREDGSTPANRLFYREFPDLFEFLCQNVTVFKEPRKRKNKPLKINFLQH